MSTQQEILDQVLRMTVADGPADADQVTVYKEVAKRLARILADISKEHDERLEECDMCGKMAIPHDEPPGAA